jgi:hypothetical protein
MFELIDETEEVSDTETDSREIVENDVSQDETVVIPTSPAEDEESTAEVAHEEDEPAEESSPKKKRSVLRIILNTVLMVMVYPPLCVASGLLGIGRFATAPFLILLEGIAVAMGRLLPAICVGGIGASIVLRRKERPNLSFLVQFAGAVWFGVTMLVAKLSGSY